MKGIDLSTFNVVTDWNKIKADGIEFVILRAGFGNTATQQDAKFKSHIEGALSVNIPIGVYWFSYARSVEEAKTEAQACIEVLKPYKNKITYPVFFDFEYDSEEYAKNAGTKVDKRYITDATKAFCEEILKAGYKTGYYTNLDYIRNKLYPNELTKYDLWLADYTGEPDRECAVQQITSTGKIDGINGNVDINTGFKAYTATETPVNKKYGTCTGDGVRVRSEAHTAAKILTSVNSGTSMQILDDDGWGWSKVKVNGVTGWMYNVYIDADGLSKPKTVYCNGTAVNLRQQPSTSAKIIKQLNKGDKLTLISINPDGWLNVDGGYLFNDDYLEIK